MTIIQTIILTSLILLLPLSIYQFFIPPISRLPGPWYTKLTSSCLIIQWFRGNRREYIHELHKRYGAVVRIGNHGLFGGWGEVSFCGMDAIKEIYGGSGFDKDGFYGLFRQFDTRTLFSTIDKFNHAKRKRHIAGVYSNTNIMKPGVLDGIHNHTQAFIEQCRKGGSVDIYAALHCYALDTASHFIFGKYGTHSLVSPADFKIMEELSYHHSLKNNLFHYHFPLLASVLGKFVKPRPSPLSNAYVFKAVKNLDAEKFSLLYTLQNAKEELDEMAIAAECMDHLAAGIDTTGDSLCFLMYYLSLPKYAGIQERLSVEIQENQERGFDELSYLDAVVREGLRCWPPIPMSQLRVVPRGGRVVGGVFVDGGTVVGVQAWSVHRLNEGVFVDGEEFVPERWLGSEGRGEMERLFFAFGGGARGCTGRHLAIAEMKILIRAVYSKFRTNVAPKMSASMEVDDQIISSRPRGQKCLVVFEERE